MYACLHACKHAVCKFSHHVTFKLAPFSRYVTFFIQQSSLLSIRNTISRQHKVLTKCSQCIQLHANSTLKHKITLPYAFTDSVQQSWWPEGSAKAVVRRHVLRPYHTLHYFQVVINCPNAHLHRKSIVLQHTKVCESAPHLLIHSTSWKHVRTTASTLVHDASSALARCHISHQRSTFHFEYLHFFHLYSHLHTAMWYWLQRIACYKPQLLHLYQPTVRIEEMLDATYLHCYQPVDPTVRRM